MSFLAIDTETHLFSTGNKAPRVVCLSYAQGTTAGLIPRGFMGQWLGQSLEHMRADGRKLLGHNIAYDAACLMSSVPELALPLWEAYDRGAVHCTMVREKLLDIAKGSLRFATDENGNTTRTHYSLGDLCKRILGIHLEKENSPRLEYARLEDIPTQNWTQEEREYPVRDAAATLMLGETQSDRAKVMNYGGFEAEAARQARSALALHLMSCWGLAVDQGRARQLQVLLNNASAELRAKLKAAHVYGPTGSKSMVAIRGMIEDAWPGAPKTAKGATKTDRETLETCAAIGGKSEDHPLTHLVNFNRVEKMLSTYIDRLVDVAMVHPEYDMADTGRTTCRNPNIQNQPRAMKGFPFGVRECFMARPGCLLISVDYDSQELRTLAQVLMSIVKHSALAERYQADPGYDPHVDFAAQLMGIDYKEALQRKKSGDKQMKEMRQRSKASNFGFPGGMGPHKFQIYARGYGLNLSEAEAKELRQRWFRQWPEMEAYFQHVQAVTRNGTGDIEQLFSGRRRGQCGFSDGANCYFQGLASDVSRTALYEVTRRCYGDPASPLYGARPVAFIHDEILLEAPEAFAHEAAEEMTKVMIEAMEQWTPDVPAKASPAMMRHWSKEAEEVRNKDGRLIAWEDRAC